uniref:Serine/threonine-protein kinase RIO1 n=1 Tax=Amblyomma aureolatum TaxID=187763 RepID=A0A1E1X4L5_9ACAR
MIAEVVEGQFDDAEEDTAPAPSPNVSSRARRSPEQPASGEDSFDDDDEVSDDGYDWDDLSRGPANVQANASAFQSQCKVLSGKYSSRINLQAYAGPVLAAGALSVLNEASRRQENERVRVRDKVERATAEQVLDPRTRIILFKLLNRGLVEQINGCVSTGKEANVYHATADGAPDRAIKIYKTSILVFKDRDRYVTGEFRFRSGYCSSNPRKMVRTWAEKEMRNLSRIHAAGLPCPKPIVLRSHVLVMEFVGKDGWPAPKLKDVPLGGSKARELYRDCVVMMRRLYCDCRLVHADLSEYNLLYHEGKIIIIDVSQSVEHDHPNALEFLRKDCTNITDFFGRRDVKTMSVRQLFDFVTDPTITEDNMDAYLERAQSLVEQGDADTVNQVEEEVFKKAYIPHRLDDVLDFEKDIVGVQEQNKKILYHTITGMKSDLSGPAEKPAILDASSGESESSESGSEDEENSDEKESKFVSTARPKDESLEEKKERKKGNSRGKEGEAEREDTQACQETKREAG